MTKIHTPLSVLDMALDAIDRKLAPLQEKFEKDSLRMMIEQPDEWKELFLQVYRLKLAALVILMKRRAYLLRIVEKPDANKYLQ